MTNDITITQIVLIIFLLFGISKSGYFYKL